ncbi:hypothetical protein JVT61DRAFT_565 [Boletus reticuloceps]|uniref:CCL2-like lectin domain-containing protein n=1 Tax=Boletus reticuloceps TaxID=495285 RepID=A0A8I2Z0U9_9AGAM|nr:hypothetical protein JVT61DRAFT_565 [Boletus reticuloceps]
MAYNGPNPGNYYIINSVLSPTGDQLATNYIGNNVPLVVSTALQFMTQRWKVTGEPNAPQAIAPLVDLHREAGPAGNFAEALLAAGFTWGMTPSGDGYTIADPNSANVWAINIAAEGQQVVLVPQGVGKTQLQVWKFVPA